MADIVIVGGGPAGCATALALYANGITGVTIVEAGCYAHPRIGESIPPDIRGLFAQTGILEAFLAEGHEPCAGSCSAWGSDELGFNDFLTNPHGSGYHLDRQRFESFLAREVTRRGMRLLTDTRFKQVRRRDDGGFTLGVNTTGDDRLELNADFLVDAGGMQAMLASRLGARKRFFDRLLAVCAFFELRPGTQQSRLTMLEAVDYGWWYVAGLPRGRLVVAVATDAANLKSRRLDEPQSWIDHCADTRHVHGVLDKAARASGKLSVLLAPSTLLEPVTGPGWLAVGDAASCYDPISSQGIYKAFASGIRAAKAIAERLKGSGDAMAAYEAQVCSEFSDYQRNRQYFYNLEQRWPESDFWAQRQQQQQPAAIALTR